MRNSTLSFTVVFVLSYDSVIEQNTPSSLAWLILQMIRWKKKNNDHLFAIYEQLVACVLHILVKVSENSRGFHTVQFVCNLGFVDIFAKSVFFFNRCNGNESRLSFEYHLAICFINETFIFLFRRKEVSNKLMFRERTLLQM